MKQSYIGFIGTNIYRAETPTGSLTGIDAKDRFLNKQDNQMVGVDFQYVTDTFLKSKNFAVKTTVNATKTPGISDNDMSGSLIVEYPNNLVDTNIKYEFIGDNFILNSDIFNAAELNFIVLVLPSGPVQTYHI